MPNNSTGIIVLGFDFGLKKIGVAVGATVTGSAQPLQPIKAINGIPNWETIESLILKWGVEAFIVGAPINMDGSDQPLTLSAKKFAARLQSKFHLPIYLVDERLTTKEAKSLVQNDKRLSKQSLDSLAAKLIIESWIRGNTND